MIGKDQNTVWPASSISRSGICKCSHVSVSSKMQHVSLFSEICGSNLCILLVMDLTLVRNMLGRGGLGG